MAMNACPEKINRMYVVAFPLLFITLYIVAFIRNRLMAILIDATMYTLIDWYRQNLTHQPLLFIQTTGKLCVCK